MSNKQISIAILLLIAQFSMFAICENIRLGNVLVSWWPTVQKVQMLC